MSPFVPIHRAGVAIIEKMSPVPYTQGWGSNYRKDESNCTYTQGWGSNYRKDESNCTNTQVWGSNYRKDESNSTIYTGLG